MTDPRALVVLSGGQDSTTCLFWAIETYGLANVGAITFDYGQRHNAELNAAIAVAQLAGVIDRHELVDLGPGILQGRSPLTDPTQPLETYESFEQMNTTIGTRVEKTFVPMRNSLFLVLAANRAVVKGYSRLVTGVCQADNANYPDCTREFIVAMERTINVSLGITDTRLMDMVLFINIPLMDLTKAESVALAINTPGAYGALAYSHTAYDGAFPPVGNDHASVLRAHGFEEADTPDPLILRAVSKGAMPMPSTDNYRPNMVDAALRVIRTDMDKFQAVRKGLDPWWADMDQYGSVVRR